MRLTASVAGVVVVLALGAVFEARSSGRPHSAAEKKDQTVRLALGGAPKQRLPICGKRHRTTVASRGARIFARIRLADARGLRHGGRRARIVIQRCVNGSWRHLRSERLGTLGRYRRVRRYRRRVETDAVGDYRIQAVVAGDRRRLRARSRPSYLRIGGGEIVAGAYTIAYASDQDDPNPMPPMGFPISPGKDFEIYSMSADGSGQKRLTSASGNDQFLQWSPDGSSIAFEGSRDGDYEIYVMKADGSDVRQLTTDPAPDSVPAWSPDGGRIAFTSFRDVDPEIYVMNADGSDQRRVTSSPGWDFVFSNWSPEGRILFNSDRDGAGPPGGPLPLRKFDLYSMKADGSDAKRLTDDPANDGDAMWSPDGTRVVFDSERDGNAEVYVMDADGSNQRRLTHSPATDLRPRGRPTASTSHSTAIGMATVRSSP